MKATRENPILYIVIPCYNEQEVLPITCLLYTSPSPRDS